MTEAFLKKPDGAYQVLVKQLEQAEEMKRSALRFSAHMSNLLREACGILEKLPQEFDVSEALACWWEKEKRKREAKDCYLLSNPNVPALDKRNPGGGGVERPNRLDGDKPRIVKTDIPDIKTNERDS